MTGNSKMSDLKITLILVAVFSFLLMTIVAAANYWTSRRSKSKLPNNADLEFHNPKTNRWHWPEPAAQQWPKPDTRRWLK
jgi:hypothetical protein